MNTQILKRFEGTVPQIQYPFHGSSSFVQNIYWRPMSSTSTVSGLSYSNHCSSPKNHLIFGIRDFHGGVYSMSNAVFLSITVTCASRTTVPFLPRHVAVGFTMQCSTLLCLQKNMNPKLHVFRLKSYLYCSWWLSISTKRVQNCRLRYVLQSFRGQSTTVEDFPR